MAETAEGYVIKIVIVEDDLVIADLAEEILIRQGYEVCGIARRIDEAIELAMTHDPEIVLVDQRLADDGLGTEFAAQLAALGRRPGILYVTGNAPHVLRSATQGQACLAKPYRPADLLRGLEIVLDMVEGRAPAAPFPRGFLVLPAAFVANDAVL